MSVHVSKTYHKILIAETIIINFRLKESYALLMDSFMMFLMTGMQITIDTYDIALRIALSSSIYLK